MNLSNELHGTLSFIYFSCTLQIYSSSLSQIFLQCSSDAQQRTSMDPRMQETKIHSITSNRRQIMKTLNKDVFSLMLDFMPADTLLFYKCLSKDIYRRVSLRIKSNCKVMHIRDINGFKGIITGTITLLNA